MKPYYVMIRFAGNYVTGFIAPQARDEIHAIKIIRTMIWVQMKAKGAENRSDGNNFNIHKLKEYMRSLKRPWRISSKNEPVVKVVELKLPIATTYWLQDMVTLSHLCNQSAWSTPRKII